MRVWADGIPRPGTLRAPLRDALLVALEGREPLEGPVVLKLRFIFKRDPALPRAVPVDQPSLGALARAVLDELVGVVYRDERQVAALHSGKEYGNVNGTELRW